jgi:hypothetical protein
MISYKEHISDPDQTGVHTYYSYCPFCSSEDDEVTVLSQLENAIEDIKVFRKVRGFSEFHEKIIHELLEMGQQ